MNANLEAIYFAEGRLTPNGASFYYEYSIKDHLGNVRVSFRANGTAIAFIQENHYYSFGLEMEGAWQARVGTENAYQYNSKELNEDFDLNWYDYGARWYDAAVGRWWSVDPKSDKFSKYAPYCYVINDPVNTIDPDGMEIVAPDRKDQVYLLKQLGSTFGDEAGKIFKFNKSGYLKVDQKALKAYNENKEVKQELKDLAAGFEKIASDKDVTVEFRTVENDKEEEDWNPVTSQTENNDGSVTLNRLYGKGRGMVLTLSGGGLFRDEGGKKKSIIVINREVAENETYTTKDNGKNTNPCASCVMVHEFLDHALPYVENPDRVIVSPEGVKYQNLALKAKESPERDGSDHKKEYNFKRN